MITKFNESLSLFRGDRKNFWCDDAWFDVFSDDALDALSCFKDKDWDELKRIVDKKNNDSWLYACMYLMGEGIHPEKEFDILISTIARSKNIDMKERCVDSIRCLLDRSYCPTEMQREILKLELKTLSFSGISHDTVSYILSVL